ncbi:uncharacterized protein LOC129003736, partial [Macrosteles quadrilineatus]|uniref:uncharacterized protein LOC129003736 n=1 Tax=Macrosteles quadrilineatus TaxID=74068 RepID=UPI0023E0E14A
CDRSQEGEELMSVEAGSRWLSHKEAQVVLRREGGEKGLPVDCCPSTLEMVEPQGGINQDGLLVELFSEAENRQRFYELSCRAGVEGKPCRFMDRRLHNQSRCVQKYSYTYAIVREPSPSTHTNHRLHHFPSFPSGGSNWMLDYIRVRSGCSCEVSPRVKRRRAKNKRGKNKRTEISEEE